jgi:hypothetical protein
LRADQAVERKSCGRLDVFWNALARTKEGHWPPNLYCQTENATAGRRLVQVSEDQM